jgi:hypothetical protein
MKVKYIAKKIGLSWVDLAVPPMNAEATASGFADWVFCEYNKTIGANPSDKPKIDIDKLTLGVITHDDIDNFFKCQSVIEKIGEQNPQEWGLLYSDSGNMSKVFTASALLVKERPLKCKPDMVLTA